MGAQMRSTLIAFLGLIALANDAWSQQEKNGQANNARGKSLDAEDKGAEAEAADTRAGFIQFECSEGSAADCYTLGDWYRQGINVPKDARRAAQLFQRACTANVAIACNELGTLYEEGNGVAKNVSRALQLYQQACDAKQGVGCVNLGRAYDLGIFVAKNLGRAAQLYQQSCDLNDATGCGRLASDYLNGTGVVNDATRAFGLYQKACDGNEFLSCAHLGRMYQEGAVVTADAARAAALYRKACDGGEANGCGLLAVAYSIGSGVSLDVTRARAFYRRACDGGVAVACSQVDAKAAAPASPTSGAPSVAGYQPSWIGQTMTVRGTVSRFVQRKVNGEPYVYLYFKERPDSTVVACTRDDRWLLGVLGVDDFQSVIGKTLEFNGGVVSQPCTEHGASLWIWERHQARIVAGSTR